MGSHVILTCGAQVATHQSLLVQAPLRHRPMERPTRHGQPEAQQQKHQFKLHTRLPPPAAQPACAVTARPGQSSVSLLISPAHAQSA